MGNGDIGERQTHGASSTKGVVAQCSKVLFLDC